MDMNLRGYLKVYEKLGSEVCESAVKQLKDVSWEKHSYVDPSTNQRTTHENDLSVTYAGLDVRTAIMAAIWDSLHDYINEIGFGWFNSWNGYSAVRFNRYAAGEEMRMHCDHIHSMFENNKSGVPILTVLGGLNDDYDGGDLLFWGGHKIELPAGSIAVFPSNFLYPHEVKPVKSGERYSFVSWAY